MAEHDFRDLREKTNDFKDWRLLSVHMTVFGKRKSNLTK